MRLTKQTFDECVYIAVCEAVAVHFMSFYVRLYNV
ncbi:MAG: hypothetical protein KatS3mg105_1272 [Gemmatales bacterium]|nr:MAG: hypothetical protein KatS3mg105_1272 [Gemmatales bacterium]